MSAQSELIPMTMVMSRREWKAIFKMALDMDIQTECEDKALGDLMYYIKNKNEIWE